MHQENIIECLIHNKLAIDWFKNGILALALSSILSIILRAMTYFSCNTDFFYSAIVLRTNDLSTHIWLMSITACIWSYNFKYNFGKTYVILAYISTILITLSTLYNQYLPEPNSYMLENIIFVLGISLFGTVTLLFALGSIISTLAKNLPKHVMRFRISTLSAQITADLPSYESRLTNFTILSSAAILILAWGCFFLSYLQLQAIIKRIPIDIDHYYALLFRSSGNLLQFLYAQIVTFILLTLFQALIGKKLQFQKFYLQLLYLNFILSFGVMIAYFFYDIVDSQSTESYASYIQHLSYIVPILSLITMFYELFLNMQYLKKLLFRVSVLCISILLLFSILVKIQIVSIALIPTYTYNATMEINIIIMGLTYFLFKYNRPPYQF